MKPLAFLRWLYVTCALYVIVVFLLVFMSVLLDPTSSQPILEWLVGISDWLRIILVAWPLLYASYRGYLHLTKQLPKATIIRDPFMTAATVSLIGYAYICMVLLYVKIMPCDASTASIWYCNFELLSILPLWAKSFLAGLFIGGLHGLYVWLRRRS